MKRFRLRSTAASCACLTLMMGGTARAGDAQTWHWKYVTQTPNGPPLTAQSTVTVAGNKVHMVYSVPLQKRQVVIESCDAGLQDVLDATTVRNAGTTYFLIRFKPSRGAVCGSGRRPAVALPADDEQYVSQVAAAVTRSAQGAGTASGPSAAIATKPSAPAKRPSAMSKATPAPSSPPRASPSPSAATPKPSAAVALRPSPSPSPSPTPAPAVLRDWVESDGLFWFVRIRNLSGSPLTPDGEVYNCRNVDTGCGPFMHTLLQPGGTATVAAIAGKRNAIPAFEYRYSAPNGMQNVAGAGSSTKHPPRGFARMSAQDLRTAQALALTQLRSPNDASAAPVVPAKLVKRGSSRLAIGETGTAVVRVTIGENGTPQEASIVSITNKALTAAAIETAVSSTYLPATQNGRAVAAKYIATFSFDGQDPATSSIPVWKRSPSPPPPATLSPAPSPAAPAPSPATSAQSPTAAAQSPTAAAPSPAAAAQNPAAAAQSPAAAASSSSSPAP
jgi:hypothetical protein